MKNFYNLFCNKSRKFEKELLFSIPRNMNHCRNEWVKWQKIMIEICVAKLNATCNWNFEIFHFWLQACALFGDSRMLILVLEC